ncbi:MAG: universal stress protein [Proteobacteria bacterium]|nr:universal stress protein [Pseudomonadota bacterium]
MKNILLVLSTTRQSTKTEEEALTRAKAEGAQLTLAFILDSSMPESIFEKMTDVGFTGERTSQELQISILDEYRRRGSLKLEEIREVAESMGVACKLVVREGAFAIECLNLVNEVAADLVILTKKKRSSLSRFIFGSAIEDIKGMSECEFLIVEE